MHTGHMVLCAIPSLIIVVNNEFLSTVDCDTTLNTGINHLFRSKIFNHHINIDKASPMIMQQQKKAKDSKEFHVWVSKLKSKSAQFNK